MAIFGKKKRAATSAPDETTDAIETEPTGAGEADAGEADAGEADAGEADDAQSFDFDAIARDLDATDGPSAFDDLMSKPAQTASADDGGDSGVADVVAEADLGDASSAFDFPMESEDTTVPAAPNALDDDFFAPTPTEAQVAPDAFATAPSSDDGVDLDTMFGTDAAPAASVAPTYDTPFDDASTAPFADENAGGAPDIEPVVPLAMPQNSGALVNTPPMLTTDIVGGSSGVAAPRKSLPLLPLLGAGALLLALLGTGWWVFGRPTEPNDAATPVPTTIARNPETVSANSTGIAPAGVNSARPTPITVPASGDAALGIPPQTLPDNRAPGGTVAVRPVPPTRVLPTGAEPDAGAVPPQIMIKLKRLWKQGAAAKKRRDYAGARRSWQEMLRVRPGHPGVQEAIDKLPRA